MIHFPPIFSMFKTVLLNFRSSRVTYTSELTKLIFSVGLGAWLIYLLNVYNEVPYRYYSVSVKKLNEKNPKDGFFLDLNIGYNEKSAKSILEEYERGVFLHIHPSTDSLNTGCLNANDTILLYNRIDTILFTKNSERIRGQIPFVDSVKAYYSVLTKETRIPNFYTYNMKGVDTIFPKTYKIIDSTKRDILYNHFDYLKSHITEHDGLKKRESLHLLGVTDLNQKYDFDLFTTNSITNYSLINRHDISQSNYLVFVDFPSTLSKGGNAISIDFNGATTFSEMYPKPDRIEMTRIFFNDPEKLKYISKNGVFFNAKFSELENLQMIRLFFLTTILGFLMGLFFSSLWNFIMLGIESYRKRLNKQK